MGDIMRIRNKLQCSQLYISSISVEFALLHFLIILLMDDFYGPHMVAVVYSN